VTVPSPPYRFDRTATASVLHDRYGELADGTDTDDVVSVAGRMLLRRVQGKAAFGTLVDPSGRIQIFARANTTPRFDEFCALSLGDWLGVTGKVMRTRRGELSVTVDDWVVLAEARRQFPDKWHGLSDVDTRYRQRYVDLWVNEEAKRVFLLRSRVVSLTRRFLEDRGFLEVETPLLHSVQGGATAKPFVTHHNALDMDLYLRIAPELYLKRLVAAGLERVFEIGRVFRNEGISPRHNPEFTMLELYWAYADYRDQMDLTEELISQLAETARALQGKEALTWEGQPLDFGRPWARLTMREAITRFAEVPAERLERAEDVQAELESRGLALPAARTYGHLLMTLFEGTVESHLFQPTFILDHPVEVSPLAKQRQDDPRFTERFELYIAGMEVANAFSELNDPDVQAERFRQQVAARERGDQEAHLFDADYVRALEHAMPPAGGNGIGIDRLTMLLTDRQSIRDVILFPLMRPEGDVG
jgi:lysyl-tRNA synthetase class 2